MMRWSGFTLVAGSVLCTIPLLILLKSQELPSCSSQPPSQGVQGDYMVLSPSSKPGLTASPLATVLVRGSTAVYRERKWLESEEEGGSSSCWLGEGQTLVLYWKGEEATALVKDQGSTITLTFPSQYSGTQLLRITPEEAQMLNAKDPVEAPPSPYTIQPYNQGKLVFLSGPPGAGKSSIAASISRSSGYVWYEGDGFMSGVNPYTPTGALEPSLAAQEQHPLVGPGLHTRREVVLEFGEQFDTAMGDYSKASQPAIVAFFTAMAADINQERARLGGDWVVAFAVPDLASRDVLRSLLGPDLLFVVLELSPQLQASRLSGRHGNDTSTTAMLESIFKIYQPAREGEERAVPFLQTQESTIEESSLAVLELISEFYNPEV